MAQGIRRIEPVAETYIYSQREMDEKVAKAYEEMEYVAKEYYWRGVTEGRGFWLGLGVLGTTIPLIAFAVLTCVFPVWSFPMQ